ncbi:molybdopterin synthase catalytic subunit [Diretmus argenteus]
MEGPAEEEKKKDVFKLSHDRLSVQEVVEAVTSTSCGAISIFIGTTRDSFEGRKVIGLEYDAYEAMVQSELTKLSVDIRARWPIVEHLCVHHRLGWVPVGEASVVIAMSSPHRHDAQQAVQYCISSLKASVPIWKKEVYETDGACWKENAECSWGGAKDREVGLVMKAEESTTGEAGPKLMSPESIDYFQSL